jgi:type II secretory pathway component HofQ
MADNDTVQLTDLEVIQQFSLAVRGATASRRDVIAALEADLAFLGGRRPSPLARSVAAVAPAKKAAPAPAAKAPAKKAPAKAARARRG